MSARSLQRVVVRMLYDPALVAAVYEGAHVPGLEASERAHLLRVDRRAWGTDPYRRSRTLQALIEELPVSVAIAGVETLDAFFSSARFHSAVQERRALVLAFADWIEPMVGATSRLERAIARARQQSKRTGRGLCMAPGIAAVSLPEGLIEWWQAISGTLGSRPLSALLEGSIGLDPAPQGLDTIHLLIERGPEGGLQLGGATSSLVRLLAAADAPASFEFLIRRAIELGAEAQEATDIIEGLLEEGLLISSTQSRSS